MSSSRCVCAVDLGAESGRVLLGRYDGRRLTTEVVHRFANRSALLAGTLYWDTPAIYLEILTGLRHAAQSSPEGISSVGVDTWGVDFGLLDAHGALLGLPVHYRDHRTDGIIEEICAKLPARQLYEQSGICFWPFNTLNQLRAMVLQRSPLLREAQSLLFTPDLLHYWLCGVQGCERAIASTSQCLSVSENHWLESTLQALDIPAHIFPEIIPSGSVLAPLRREVAAEVGGSMQVIAPASHDTVSAFIATPFSSPDAAVLSCGTWSILGLESDVPLLTPEALAAGVMSQRSIAGRYAVLKNNMGLWLVQQTRTALARDGKQYDYARLAEMAERGAPFRSWIDANDLRYYAPDNMLLAMQQACRENGQAVPERVEDVMRCVLESLAFAYRQAVEQFEALRETAIPALHIIGGGAQNRVLCQWTANALGRPVIAGPIEATAQGNLLVQLMAQGEVASVQELRDIVRQSNEMQEYQPQEIPAWNEAYGRYTHTFDSGANER